MTSARGEANEAFSVVVEGYCPLCQVRLIAHGTRACCPCGGCSYSVRGHTLSMHTCADHPSKMCEHWMAIWRRVGQ